MRQRVLLMMSPLLLAAGLIPSYVGTSGASLERVGRAEAGAMWGGAACSGVKHVWCKIGGACQTVSGGFETWYPTDPKINPDLQNYDIHQFNIVYCESEDLDAVCGHWHYVYTCGG